MYETGALIWFRTRLHIVHTCARKLLGIYAVNLEICSEVLVIYKDYNFGLHSKG